MQVIYNVAFSIIAYLLTETNKLLQKSYDIIKCHLCMPFYSSSKWSASRAKLTSSRGNRCFWWLHPTFNSKPSCLARGRHIYQFAKHSSKGGLISESFSLWLKSPKMGAKSRSWVSSLFVDSPQGCSLALILDIWAKVKNFLKLSHL